MARNVEIKARIESADSLMPKAAAIATDGPIEIEQDDTFFQCENARLKLRMLAHDQGELIVYRRPNAHGPKESQYFLSPTSAPESLRSVLSAAYGVVGRVRKHRTLFLAGRTRIHLDRVEGLGHFLELEVVLADDEPVEAGIREARSLMQKLGIDDAQLIDGAYVDLAPST